MVENPPAAWESVQSHIDDVLAKYDWSRVSVEQITKGPEGDHLRICYDRSGPKGTEAHHIDVPLGRYVLLTDDALKLACQQLDDMLGQKRDEKR